MRKPAILTIVALSFAMVVSVGLLIRSSIRAASLEEKIATLEADRTDLKGEVDAARKEVSAVQARLRPTRFRDELTVEPGVIQSYRFTPGAVSGTLSGTWRSSGRGFGGADDTIKAFRLTDPRDAIVEASRPESGFPSSGRFFVKVTEKGTYTFFFDNKGLFRTTARRIFIEGEFRPD
jgi:hypothetical protein